MSKIMVVEDDASLREIYGIRITAEGYDVVSAGDGEEALAVAVREKPDLILSDVMMPKISGFDMLDILRSTPETADIKVVMMTALSAEDQRQRGERLGADRYLVKSQVGIEDVINTIHEVLGDRATSTAESQPTEAPVEPAPTEAPVETPASEPALAETPVTEPAPETPPAPEAAQPTVQPEPTPQPDFPPTQTETIPPEVPTPQPQAGYEQFQNPAQ
ncbi:response regulator [Candidatus Saccharibacteria bacterium]|nr:response regulator [Candidatus Saccharibacteria bacterium]